MPGQWQGCGAVAGLEGIWLRDVFSSSRAPQGRGEGICPFPMSAHMEGAEGN